MPAPPPAPGVGGNREPLLPSSPRHCQAEDPIPTPPFLCPRLSPKQFSLLEEKTSLYPEALYSSHASLGQSSTGSDPRASSSYSSIITYCKPATGQADTQGTACFVALPLSSSEQVGDQECFLEPSAGSVLNEWMEEVLLCVFKLVRTESLPAALF